MTDATVNIISPTFQGHIIEMRGEESADMFVKAFFLYVAKELHKLIGWLFLSGREIPVKNEHFFFLFPR